MPDEKYLYENLPIPTYDEATSSRTATPSSARPDEPGNDEERTGLLGTIGGARLPEPTRRANYRPPSVEDDFDDVEGLLGHNERHSIGSEDEEVRQEMEQMEVLDPPVEQSIWTKRMSSISQSLSWIRLPFNLKMPKWKLSAPKLDANLFILIGRFFAVFLVMGVVYLIFVSGIFTSAAQRMAGQMYDPESVRIFVQSQISADKMRDFLKEATEYDHLAGTEGDYFSAQFVKDNFIRVRDSLQKALYNKLIMGKYRLGLKMCVLKSMGYT
jgi:hypothetical protein